MSDFIRVAEATAIPDPGRLVLEVDEQFIVLLHVGGEFFAIDDVCTHDGGPLGEGRLDGYSIACPRHGAKFDIRTGQALTLPARAPTRSHEVRVENNEIYIKLSA